MLSVAEAFEIVLSKCRPLPSCIMPIGTTSLGSILAEDITSDLDMPPFDKALMDGFAIRCEDLAESPARLPIQAEVTAGQSAPPLLPRHAIQIMTGAPLPPGADAVVRIEDTQSTPESLVELRPRSLKPGQFILRQGRELRVGETILAAGSKLRPQELGMLATLGKTSARMFPRPTVAILPTGDELVDSSMKPGPNQLRNSNGPMLAGQTVRAGGEPVALGIARDVVADLKSRISEGLKSSILILSGGVSMGKKDLVPHVLQELALKPLFHQVAMKPGKPLLFGTCGETLVFGLPGNPASSFCSFELFVRPAIRALSGHGNTGIDGREALLDEDVVHESDRPTFHPARLRSVAAVDRVNIVPWLGSPDLRALTQANALLRLPAGKQTFPAGHLMSVIPLD